MIDRLVTILLTAALTSAVWFFAGQDLLTVKPQSETPSAESAIGRAPIDGQIAERAISGGSPTNSSTDAPLLIPVDGTSANDLTDNFSEMRGDGVRLHEAIDIMAPRGTPVRAAAAGLVEKLHDSREGGKSVYLRSKDRTRIHYYAHLDSYAASLEEGDELAAGDPIGTVGSTGNTPEEAPHLHFAVLETTADAMWWEPANAINPFALLSGR